MTVLITGAQGQLGQAIQRECTKRGIEMVATDLGNLNITDVSAVREAVEGLRPAVIINCAAYNDVDHAERDEQPAQLVNAVGPRNLALAAESVGAVLVHFGTDYVFDGQKREPYRVEDEPRPLNAYGRTKLLGERHVQECCGRYFLVRLSWLFGAGSANFPTKVLRWAKGSDSIRVVTDQVSCPSYAVDLAPAILDLVDTEALGLHHMSNRGFCSRFDWARLIVETAGLDVEVTPVTSSAFPEAAPRPAFSAMEPGPLPATIGRELPLWQDATRRYLAEIGVAG